MVQKIFEGKTTLWWWQRKHLRAIFGFASDFSELEFAGLQYWAVFGKGFLRTLWGREKDDFNKIKSLLEAEFPQKMFRKIELSSWQTFEDEF